MRKLLLWICGILKDQEVSDLRAENSSLRKSAKSLRSQIEQYQEQEDRLRAEIDSLQGTIRELQGEIVSLEALNFGYTIQIKKLQGQEEVLRYEIQALNESHKALAFLSEASRKEAELQIALKNAEIELASVTGVGKFTKDRPNGNDDQSGGYQ